MIFKMLIISTLVLSCSHITKRGTFADLKVGMSQAQVETMLGKPWETSYSASGSGDLNYIYKDGYVWYDTSSSLRGFAKYEGTEDFSYMTISRASGYKIKDSDKKKVFLRFENLSGLKSGEGNLVFLENRKSLEAFFSSHGYQVVKDASKAEVEIAVRLGVSNPDKTQELNVNSFSNSFANAFGGSHTASGISVNTSTNIDFHRALEFVAKDLSIKDKDESILWSAVVVSTGKTEDIRTIFPYLFYASSSLINKSVTHKGYNLAAYHTGVWEIVGRDIPRVDRLPSSLDSK